MQITHKKKEGFIACVDTVSSKDNCIKYQLQMFDYDDPKEGHTIVINVIEAQWDVSKGRATKVTPKTTNFSGDLAYETDFKYTDLKKAKAYFKSLCNEFDPDVNKELGEANGDPYVLIR